METRILSLSDINDRCDYLCGCEYPYYEQLREAFIILLLSGVRSGELFDIHRWAHVSDYTFTLQPQKGNNQRTIVLDDRCLNFRNAVIGQYTPFQGLTVNQLLNLLKRVRTWVSQLSGEKDIALYIFRYRYVKQLSADGYSISQIAANMGYVETMTPNNYLEAIITENFEVPPTPTVVIGSQTWMLGNMNIDDGLGGVYSYNNDPIISNEYGYLYNHAAALRIAAQVDGFRFPSVSDIDYLIGYLGGSTVAGGALKESGFVHWNSPNTGANNSSGFSAFAGGRRSSSGFYRYLSQTAYFWLLDRSSVDVSYCFYLSYLNSAVVLSYFTDLTSFSVRLIAD